MLKIRNIHNAISRQPYRKKTKKALSKKDGTSKEETVEVSFNFGIRKLIKEKMIPLEINSGEV